MDNLTKTETLKKHLADLELLSKCGKLDEVIADYAKIVALATLEAVKAELDDTASLSDKLYWEAMRDTALANMQWLAWKRANDMEKAAKAAKAANAKQ